MEKLTPPSRSPHVIPLARDAEGNVVEIPEGAVGWRIRRQTGGRPRLQLDARKQPMLFPLEYTLADAEDILPHGSYLLDLIDKSGEPLGVTIPLTIQPMRNAATGQGGDEDEEEDRERRMPALPTTTNEVRLVLEANVRSTQLAFQHNERTLEMGLWMAETLRDGVQVLASSQADWIKSLAAARGFFRGSQGALPPVEVKQLTVHAGDDGSSDEDLEEQGNDDGGPPSPAPSGHWMDQLGPTLIALTQQIMPLLSTWANKTRGNPSAPAAPPVVAAAAPPPEPALDTTEAHAASLRRAVAEAASPGPGINFVRLLQGLPPSTLAKINAVQARMDAADRSAAIQILQHYDADGLNELLLALDHASLDDATGYFRRLAADWRVTMAEQQAARARAVTNADPLAAPATPSPPADDGVAKPKAP